MSPKFLKRMLLVLSLLILSTLACSGNDILRTVRGTLCSNTGGEWVLIRDGADEYYYCERYREDDPDADPESPPIANDEELASGMEFFGDWHGPRCADEDVGTFMYEWSINLMQNPKTKVVVGTIKFHNCPGGGKVLYHVVGFTGNDGIVSLEGTKKTGGGQLYTDAEEYQHFNVDPESGEILP